MSAADTPQTTTNAAAPLGIHATVPTPHDIYVVQSQMSYNPFDDTFHNDANGNVVRGPPPPDPVLLEFQMQYGPLYQGILQFTAECHTQAELRLGKVHAGDKKWPMTVKRIMDRCAADMRNDLLPEHVVPS